ncbi:hypothetical protein GCM10010305_31450 [Streptomyces termitum]|uniref:Uncharacterized protein n=1 Tax=Streptomyces termitum TaxID=67368 RepID=A0A918WAH1_9ACTN|nr:hypothetical protein GCM10010305_31450 [Streptomyces termitum]
MAVSARKVSQTRVRSVTVSRAPVVRLMTRVVKECGMGSSCRPVAGKARPRTETPLTGPAAVASFRTMSRTALLTTRGHIDLLRVASAACPRGC